MISVNITNVITIMLIALLAFALYNFVATKFGVKLPYLQ